MTQLLPRIWYPLLMLTATYAFFALLTVGAAPLVAAYLPIIIAGMMIVALELYFPENPEWRPQLADIQADAAFMALIQVVVPRVLAPTAAILLARWTHDTSRMALWPHEWPLTAQMILMVLAVDFMRYWLHRACHYYMPLWRLHEVHHSPDILYTVNVARFHPLEKVLHFTFDSVPFLLLGVAPEVIAGYFLLYSVNGFFQHSNLRLRYGWLNYIVGSAETHRWHHARDPKTASCNFGNTTIVWDLLFGTWSLPGKIAASNIGIMDRNYPKGFRAQLMAPFRGRNA
jgi:ornithine lipid hydroxylase